MWSHYGDGIHDSALARLHAALILTLKGTPFLYYGEEIGMTDLALTDLRQIRDTAALIQYRVLTEEQGLSSAEAFQRVARTTRDRSRSPMQWTDAPNAGFSPPEVSTWLPVNPTFAAGVNVADQERDPGALLQFYQRLLAVRRATPALIAGEYTVLHPDLEEALVFTRATPEQTILVGLNFSDRSQTIMLEPGLQAQCTLFSSADRPASDGDDLMLAPFEIFVGEVGSHAPD